MKTPEFLFTLEPETAHHLAIFGLKQIARSRFLLRLLSHPPDPRLRRTVFGLQFPNPIGLAAGFDKSAVALPAWEALGFGFVEAGTITARAQPGNPKPRIFRLRDQGALINRLGFNNDGAERVAERLRKLKAARRWPRIPVGINIGKSKVTPIEEASGDYVRSFEQLYGFGDYFVLNISSPNTPGLRTLQNKAALAELLAAIQESNARLAVRHARAPVPLLVKIAPDLEFAQIAEIIALAEENRLSGIVATNTTLDQSSLPESDRQEGGLSGKPLRERSTAIVRFLVSHSVLPVIAAGGILDAESAREKLDAGAALIQLYTGFVYRGPELIQEICAELR